jgi:hypothetical protein
MKVGRTPTLRGTLSLALPFLLITLSLAADTGSVDSTVGGKRVGDNPAARQIWFMRGRRTANGKAPAEMLRRAWQQRETLRKAQAQREQKRRAAGASATGSSAGTSPGLLSVNWTSLGPAPVTGMGNIGDASGRVTAVAVDPNDSTGNTVYVGGAYGGVWKSTNAAASLPSGVTWTAMFDTTAPTLSIGAVAVQPNAPAASSRVVLVGTGEPNNAIDSYYGQGILRSTDGGSTWNTSSIINQTSDASPTSFVGIGFSKFAFSTANNQTVVAGGAVTPIGNLSNLTSLTGSHSGIYYSSDAGATWKTAAATDSGTQIQWARITDVVYSPKLDRFFAFIAYHGLYESTDNTAASWTRLANQPDPTDLTTANCPTNPLSTACKAYRGELALQANTGDLYVIFVDINDNDMGVWKATFDGSGNVTGWTKFSTSAIDSCASTDSECGTSQGFYNLYLAALPNGSNTDLYVGAVNLYKCQVTSTNSTCSTWLNLTHVYDTTCGSSYQTMHPDEHAISWNVGGGSAGAVMFFGNDGGIYRSLNSFNLTNTTCTTGSGNTWDDLNDTIGSLTQFIAVTNHPTDSTVIMGGTQDNGSPAMSTSDGQTSGMQWFEAWGGDGGYSAIDPAATATTGLWYATNTGVSIASCNFGGQCITAQPFNLIIYDQPTAQAYGLSTWTIPDTGAFYTPWILDPADPTKAIIGTCRVWRGPANDKTAWSSTSFANALSNKLIDGTSTTACSGPPTTNDDVDNEAVSAVAAGGPKNANGSSVIWVGTATNTGTGTAGVYVNTNATTGIGTWTNVTGSINPNRFPVSSIALDPTDTTGKTAYATIQGFMGNSTGAGHVWKTTNAGATWTDVGIGLPDAPANAIVVDPTSNTTLYVGTDVGVYVTQDGGVTWNLYGSGLPNVAVFDLKAFNSGGVGKLRAATHGRGVWEIPLAASVVTTPSYTLTVPTTATVLTTSPTAASTTTINISYTSQSGNLTISGTCSAAAIAGSTCQVNGGNSAAVASGATVSVPMTVTVPVATSLTPGSYTVAVSTMDTSGSGALPQSASVPVTINSDFSVASSTASQTVTAGGSGTYTIQVTPAPVPQNTAVTLSCSGLPSKASCSFNPASVTPGSAAASSTMTITTTAATTALLVPPARPFGNRAAGVLAMLAGFGMPLFGVVLIGAGKRPRKYLRLWLLLAIALLTMGMIACGGGSSTTKSVTVPGTPAGTYTITVTGTAGSVSHSTTVQLVVQ